MPTINGWHTVHSTQFSPVGNIKGSDNVKKKLNFKIFVMLMIGWFVAMVSIVIGVYAYKNQQAAEYDKLAVPYIKQVIPKLSQWDPATTRQLMAPEVLEGISEELFTGVINVFSKLGQLQSIEEPKFKKAYTAEETKIDTVVAYTTDAKYENGDATIAIQLLIRDGSLSVFRFDFKYDIQNE